MYARTQGGRPLTFEAAAVWRRNMIMRDQQTRTLWQHATGEALVGPFQGLTLTPLDGELTTWGAWRAEHPQSRVVLHAEKWPGLLPLRVTETLLEGATASGFVPGLTRRDARLPHNEAVIGVTREGVSRAYPLAELAQRGSIDDTLGGVALRLSYDERAQRVRVQQRETGASVPFQRTWWGGWYEFHPLTEVYQAPDTSP